MGVHHVDTGVVVARVRRISLLIVITMIKIQNWRHGFIIPSSYGTPRAYTLLP